MERFLTARDVADVLQIKASTVYGWIFRRTLPRVKLGRFVRIAPEDFRDFLRLRRRGDFATIASDRTQSCPERG